MEASALVYLTLTAVTLLLALFVKRPLCVSGRTRQDARSLTAELAIFLLLFGVSACRIAVGNDYWVYRFNFRLIAQNRHVSSESGFNAIVYGMQKLFGYDNYLPIFALFSFLTVLFFALALHEQSENYLFTLFLLLTGGYYFNSLNSVRYYLALAIALYAMRFCMEMRYLPFLFWIILGTAFHKSILLVIPAYLFALLLSRIRLRKWMLIPAGLVALSLIFCQDLYRELIFRFYPFYRDSAFDVSQLSLTNIAKCAAVILMCLIFCFPELKKDPDLRFGLYLNFFALVVYFCGSFIPETSRIGYYMIISQIFLIPKAIASIPDDAKRLGIRGDVLKKLLTAAVCLAFLGYFAFYLRKMYDVDIRLLPYRNWIFQ